MTMNYWSTARNGCLVLGAGALAYAIIKKNPVMLLALYGTHLVEYLAVARKAGKEVWYDDLRCFLNTMLYGFTFWLPMKLEIE